MSLLARVLLLVLFATLAPALALTFTLVREQRTEMERARERLDRSTERIASEVADGVRATLQLQHALAQAPELHSTDRARCSGFLARELRENPQLTGLLTINPDGRLFCDSLRSGRELDLNDRQYFRDVMHPGAVYGIEPAFGRLTGVAVLQIAYAVRGDAGEVKFALLASLNLEKFMEARARALPVDAAAVGLVDAKGTLLTWHPPDPALRGTSIAGTELQRIARGRERAGLDNDFELGGVPRVWAAAALAKYPQAGLSVVAGASREALDSATNQRLRHVLGILALVSVLAFAGAWTLVELGVRRHTARIIRATRRLSLGDFGSRIGWPYPRGELGRVMVELDATAARIQAQSGEIRRLNDGLEARVAARTADLEAALRQVEARTQEVEMRNQLLADANLYKSQFLATMSHELRTPLNAVIGHAELIESTLASDTAGMHLHAKQVRASGRELLATIDDLLELARIVAGAQRPRLEACEARAIAADAVTAARPAAAAKRIGLALEPGPEIECSVDRGSMQKLLKHLLANAVKFTAEGGKVAVRVTRETSRDGSDWVRFAIADTGIGIAAADMERLFAPFVQLETGLARRFGGTGLGLALVKGLAELQGGTLAAQSEPGKGSTFSVLMPLAGPARGVADEARSGEAA